MGLVKSVCVYCGSRVGHDPAYEVAAHQLGRLLARNGMRLVYGGGRAGLMGVLARAALEAGGAVLGILPDNLREREIAQEGLTELVITQSMHERKALMFENADAFVTLPGGIGTLDETIEMLSWRQLMLHTKPLVLADINGYWQPFLATLQSAIAGGFAGEALRDFYAVVRDIERIPAVLEGLKERLSGR